MKIKVPQGKYIIAVSGGVDSVVLLDLLSNLKGIELVIAHFNHGIRNEAIEDEIFVKTLAKKYNLKFEVGHGNLGPRASEQQARTARYNFLDQIKQKHEAAAIMTAHHQDDVIETALINILRGTGPRGLISLTSTDDIIRPLLNVAKKEVLAYAKLHKLNWVEDQTNQDEKYLRNKVRRILNQKLSDNDRAKLLAHQKKLQQNYEESDGLATNLANYIFEDAQTIKRQAFIFMPNDVANELLLRWLREHKIEASRQLVERLSVVIKTGKAGSLHNIDKAHNLTLGLKTAHLRHLC